MLLRLLTIVHGHAGVLAAIALLHPAILLRAGRPLTRGTRWSVGLTAFTTAFAYALGIALYPSYRAAVKRELFTANFQAGVLFETKEHLAYAVVTLTIGASLAVFLAPRSASGIRRGAAAVFAVAALLCLATAGLGTYVSAIRSFPPP